MIEDCRFNGLERENRYFFMFVGGVTLEAVLHELFPDGTLKVSNSGWSHFLNPDNIVYARDLGD